MNATFSINPEFAGIEITFPEKPGSAVLESLKNLGFRWHRVKKLWYAKETAERLAFASSIAGGTDAAESPAAAPAVPSRLSLWDRTRTDSLPAYGTENAVKDEIRAACKKNGWSYGRAAADYFRRHLKARFPEVKFSITSERAGWLDDCRIRIKASPYSREYVIRDRDAAWGEVDHWEESPELAAVLNYCEKLHSAADADDGDYYADYGARHDLYGDAAISYDYQQIPPTDADLKEIEAFRAAKEEAERKEAEEEARRIEEESARREIEAKQAAELAKIEAAKVAEIESAAVVVDLEESEQKAFTGILGGIGKESNLSELREEIAERNQRENAVVSRIVKLTDPEHLAFFENHFLEDFSFFSGKGGSKTADVRLNRIEEYYRLTQKQRETVESYLVDCVAVSIGDEVKYIVDPEGFTYARYVFVPDAETKEIPAAEFERNEEDASREKEPFYLPAPISEQIETAGMKAGDPVSVLHLDGMLCGVFMHTGKLLELVPTEYAQYKDAGKLDFIPSGKRKGRRLFFHQNEPAVIYKGILPPVPEKIQFGETSDENMKLVRYMGMDSENYLRDVLKYYESLGFSPVVDTFQR